eukprot:Nk52_evm1s1993 gene=Nk52_evmTU1s1993
MLYSERERMSNEDLKRAAQCASMDLRKAYVPRGLEPKISARHPWYNAVISVSGYILRKVTYSMCLAGDSQNMHSLRGCCSCRTRFTTFMFTDFENAEQSETLNNMLQDIKELKTNYEHDFDVAVS